MGLGEDHRFGGGRRCCSDLFRKWRVLGALVVLVFGGLGTGKAVAGGPGTFPYFMAPLLLGEISLPQAGKIYEQDHFGYCGVYALASFLELWGKSQGKSGVEIDPSYIAFAYNRLASSGNDGSYLLWTVAAVQLYGAVPLGALAKVATVAWPISDWRDRHTKLIDPQSLDDLLYSKFHHHSQPAEFDPHTYRTQQIEIDFRWFKVYESMHRENFKRKSAAVSEGEAPAQYRYGSYTETRQILETWMRKIGLDTEYYPKKAETLYSLIVKQLYWRRPVLLSINPTLAVKRFSFYDVLGGGDLVEKGEGEDAAHAMTAVAHCDRTASESRDPLCQTFAKEMESREIKECIVLQNSWGIDANQKGYVCLSKNASLRMLRQAYLLSSLDKKQRQAFSAAR